MRDKKYQIAIENGIKPCTYRWRLRNGYSPEEALHPPKPLKQIAQENGVSYHSLTYRIKTFGMTIDQAIDDIKRVVKVEEEKQEREKIIFEEHKKIVNYQLHEKGCQMLVGAIYKTAVEDLLSAYKKGDEYSAISLEKFFLKDDYGTGLDGGFIIDRVKSMSNRVGVLSYEDIKDEFLW